MGMLVGSRRFDRRGEKHPNDTMIAVHVRARSMLSRQLPGVDSVYRFAGAARGYSGAWKTWANKPPAFEDLQVMAPSVARPP